MPTCNNCRYLPDFESLVREGLLARVGKHHLAVEQAGLWLDSTDTDEEPDHSYVSGPLRCVCGVAFTSVRVTRARNEDVNGNYVSGYHDEYEPEHELGDDCPYWQNHLGLSPTIPPEAVAEWTKRIADHANSLPTRYNTESELRREHVPTRYEREPVI